jgi:hypothetical protein
VKSLVTPEILIAEEWNDHSRASVLETNSCRTGATVMHDS